MPLLTRATAAKKSTSKDDINDSLPPPESVVAETVPKSKTKSARKKASKAKGKCDQPSHHADTQSTFPAGNVPVDLPANHPDDDEGGDGDDEGEHTGHTGVDRQELQNARDEEDEGEHTVTGIDGQEPQNASDDVSLIESSPSGGDYSSTRKKQKRQQHMQQGESGEITTVTDVDIADSDADGDDDDDDRSSSNDKGKKSPLKRGRLSAEAKEDICSFSTQVLEMAQTLADRHSISRKNILIAAGFGIKESRRVNIANVHSQWYAATHTKPDELSREDYARQISANYHTLVDGKTGDEKASSLKEVTDWAASREDVVDDEVPFRSLTTRIMTIRDKFSNLSQSVENLYDVSVIGALIYRGSDAAGQQLSTLFTGSPVFRQLIDKNQVNVRDILDRLRIAVKTPDLIAQGFNIPTFNSEPAHEFGQRTGESLRDRDRRVTGIMFRDILASFFPAQNLKLYIPWKRWLDVAAKEELCIVDWIDSIMPPGPDFDIKGLDSGELRELVGPYIDAILEGHDSHGTFSVVRWSEEHRALPITDPKKGLIPLVVTRSGTPVRRVRDSPEWKKLAAKAHKKAARAKDGQDLESDDECEDPFNDDDEYNGNQSDSRREVQHNATWMHSRSSKEYLTQPRLQPKPRTGTISRRQQSVQLGISDHSGDGVTRPHPPPPSTARTDSHNQQFAVPSKARHPSHNSRSQPSGNPTQHISRSLPSHARTRYGPPNSARPRSLAPSPNLSPPRQGTKRRDPEWSDDGNTEPRANTVTGPYFHHINTQGQMIPNRRGEANSFHSRSIQASVPQQIHQRHPQHSDPPHASSNKRPRASTSQVRASHSIPHDDQASRPSTSQRWQPPHHQSFRSPGRYTVQSATIGEEVPQEEGGENGYDSQDRDCDPGYYRWEDDAHYGNHEFHDDGNSG